MSETLVSYCGRHNLTFERTGCKNVTAPKKSMEEYALFELGVAPVPAFQLGRYKSLETLA